MQGDMGDREGLAKIHTEGYPEEHERHTEEQTKRHVDIDGETGRDTRRNTQTPHGRINSIAP